MKFFWSVAGLIIVIDLAITLLLFTVGVAVLKKLELI